MSFSGVLLLLALVAALVFMMKKKVTSHSSCCRSQEALEPKIKPKDRNKSHYPYHYEAHIEGMVCSNCARRVENEFNKNDGIMARVDLYRKKSAVLSKKPLNNGDVRKILNETSYVLKDFKELSE